MVTASQFFTGEVAAFDAQQVEMQVLRINAAALNVRRSECLTRHMDDSAADTCVHALHVVHVAHAASELDACFGGALGRYA
ncbi:hypothetical protein PPTG_22010 [Phytophthora nicotianae INRA-310]|uniref:Uncharacterized protein n=2 Tax=Phytophthora nicotianae TaxID=4792 RepID=W2QNW8_PHYN3|nr:hypothetical protein PPTG_22009 [Phytophthora nicotianae INRA-310]XP_008899865.1 hypothetical protein PPTG_22010 [Phytophthora nicotianae INRA-310]ETI55046.1 hypothetical protein F443_02228 [Phytophthora nicotianae P1569]ETN14788.1 hypothetical protein PPTG_22009 [Phytophthora nicotianae INRA-310]ETN14790.1 hypothetical protein PPTG_22010 [Phytophthora nicotianae INRA-310]